MGSTGQASKLRDAFGGTGRRLDLKIFVKDVRDRHGRKRPLTVRPWSTVKDVKDQLQQLLAVPPSAQKLFPGGPLQIHGRELPNHWTLQDAGIYRSGETLLFDIREGSGGLSLASPDSVSLPLLQSQANAVTPSNTALSRRSQVGSPLVMQSASCDVCVSGSMLDCTPRALHQLIQKSRRGMLLGFKPELGLDGSGGTYFLHDARKVKIGVFKPADEEPYAENNPRGYIDTTSRLNQTDLYDENDGGMTLRAGVKPGEACIREVAAFLLDHSGFSGVPMTTLVEAKHPAFHVSGSRLNVSQGGASIGSHALSPNTSLVSRDSFVGSSAAAKDKIGSFQEYIHVECSMDDLSPSKIDVEDVHRIAILDIRLMNADRNLANLLVKRTPDDKFELVPIDHGFCLRSVCDVAWFDWCWLDWPQLKEPLSKRSKEYILSLDIEADVRLLKERLNIETKALDFFRASSQLLQAGVKAGLTLYDIAVMCCRNDNAGEIPAKLEVLSSKAAELATSAVENGRWHHAAASRALAAQLEPKNFFGKRSKQVTSPSIFKSASSANFSSHSSSSFGIADVRSPPDSAHTSGSDSGSECSSDFEDEVAGHEDCEEWAAALVADVNMEVSRVSCPIRSDTSLSFQSNDDDESQKLSSSPPGFWHTRPGSPIRSTEENDSWSPYGSPRTSPRSSMWTDGSDSSLATFGEDDITGAYTTPTADPPAPPLHMSYLTQSVQPSRLRKGMSQPRIVRSQSYSAFSFNSISEKLPETASGMEQEQFRLYYMKFVDLLIVRETLAASQKSG